MFARHSHLVDVLVVTVALGSTLATILLSKDVALMEGLAAFVTLIVLQYVVAWLSVRSKTIRELVKSTPRLLYYRKGSNVFRTGHKGGSLCCGSSERDEQLGQGGGSLGNRWNIYGYQR